MAVSTYSDLRNQIGYWLGDRTDLTSRTPDFIQLAEGELNRSIRARQMETRATSTADDYMDLPADYLEMRDVQLNTSAGNKSLELKSPREIDRLYSSTTGEPKAYAIIGGEMQLGPAPDGAYTVELDYYAKIPDLASNSTNWLLTAHPDVYLFAALRFAIPFIKDSEWTQAVQGAFSTAMGSLIQAERRQRWSGPPMAMSPS